MNGKIKILYIDDEEINLELFRINFSKKYEVITGLSGHEGLDILDKNNDVKVVISDMRMPEMNGIEFIMRAKNKHPQIKFFILTGFDITEEIIKAISKGFVMKYFRKPFNMADIERAIDNAL
ncbi:MAG: response regulator [Bacteroidales bacterium]|nr:response regulator [Bacteroidales bacterium]